MKDYICKASDTGKLNFELDKVQSKARVRIIDELDIKHFEYRLLNMIGIKKDSVGVKVIDIDLNAHRFCGSYKGIPESTKFSGYINRSGELCITSISRKPCSTSHGTIELTEAAKDAVSKTAIKNLF